MTADADDRPQGDLVVVTGMTGAGRSTAAKELEDLGFYVVDNLPPSLLPDAVRLVDQNLGREQAMAVVVDVRSGSFFHTLHAQLAQGATGRRTTLVFLDATDEVLVRRQEAARRPHPLQGSGRLLDGLTRERGVLADLRSDADLVIDTSALNVHQLTDRIAESFGSPQTTRLKVTLISFGFKYGIPVDADFLADMRFLPNPYWVPELRASTGSDQPVADFVMKQDGRRGVPRLLRADAGRRGRGLPAGGQAVHAGRHRVHRRQAPQRRDERGDRPPAARARVRRQGQPPRPGTRMKLPRLKRADRAQAVVALGGGHGLHASLSALRLLVDDLTVDELTAIVTVADNGGSSGRLRGEFGVLPPGDLRMALAALCGDDQWGDTWARLLQHRFQGEGEMRGHVVGNLLIVGLWELLAKDGHGHVDALDWVGRLLGAKGRVLPMALTPMDITAQVRGVGDDPDELTTVRGQVEVATTDGVITSISLVPADPPVSPDAIAAIRDADWVVLGPGSWFTSVLPHLMVPALRQALVETDARMIVVLNLEQQAGETEWLRPGRLPGGAGRARPRPARSMPFWPTRGTPADELAELQEAVDASGARLVVDDVSIGDGTARHDPAKLAAAYARILAEGD